MTTTPPFTTRPAKADEIELCYDLHRETMRGYVEQTFGPWNEDYQYKTFRAKFPFGRLEVVLVDGRVAGYIDVERLDDGVHLNNIRIRPDVQNRGLGTALIERVLAQARGEQVPVFLQVYRVNPARALYERLGFGVYEETETHYRMRAE